MKRMIATVLLLLASSLSQGAVCSVSEFAIFAKDLTGAPSNIMVMPAPSPTTQIVTATTATASAAAFADTTRFLWVNCTEIMHVQIGTSPATGLAITDWRIPLGGIWIGLNARAARLGTLKIAFCDIDCA